MRLAQYRVTTVKIITACWLFILQPIKAIRLVKHPVHVLLLEGTWLRCVFFRMTCRLGIFFFWWYGDWMLNFFYFLLGKILFFLTWPYIFFPYSTYMRVFNFRQIFKGKSHPRLICRLTYARKSMILFKLLTSHFSVINLI